MRGKGRPFQKGQPGGPGRPKGGIGGRKRALIRLDQMMAKEGNLDALEAAWQRLFDKNPAGFFQKVVAPLMPSESRVELDVEPKAIARILKRGEEPSEGRPAPKARAKGKAKDGPSAPAGESRGRS